MRTRVWGFKVIETWRSCRHLVTPDLGSGPWTLDHFGDQLLPTFQHVRIQIISTSTRRSGYQLQTCLLHKHIYFLVFIIYITTETHRANSFYMLTPTQIYYHSEHEKEGIRRKDFRGLKENNAAMLGNSGGKKWGLGVVGNTGRHNPVT